MIEKTDLVIPDLIPIVVKRTYRQGDSVVRPFGVGMSFEYHLWLQGEQLTYSYAELILADGGRIYYDRISPGTSYADAVYEHTRTPTRWYKSVLAWNTARGGFDLTLAQRTTTVSASPSKSASPVTSVAPKRRAVA